MRKIIILTFILLIISIISDLIVSNKIGGFMSISYAKMDVNLKPYSEYVVLYEGIKGTVYHAVKSQTDSTPLQTADMSIIDTTKVNKLRWVALSRDLLKRKFTDRDGFVHYWKGKIKLGDTIWIDYDKETIKKISNGNKELFNKLTTKYERIKGYWIVHDVMGNYYTKKNDKGEDVRVSIYHSIDFLQDQKTGMLDAWDRHIIIKKKRKV